ENLNNVIQLDAVPFPTTDICANAEELPFLDESFDGVVLCATLEHVSNPTLVLREVRRVCKIGGHIYADWTSVHPYHGFPHHCLNATETGLKSLMRDVAGTEGTVGCEDTTITIREVLSTWIDSMESSRARDLARRMTVGDLLAVLQDP